MKKVIKIGFPIVCVAVIGGTFILLNKTTEKINRNKLVEDENTSFEENIVENTVENEIIENIISVDSEEAKIKEEENEKKAVELVEKLAPPVTNSYYTNEGKVGDYYLVAIRDDETKLEKIYYTVDIENEQIEVYKK